MTPLVGQNNVGKSNIIAALCWGVKHTSLGDSDFCDTSTAVSVELVISGIDEAILLGLLVAHRARVEPLLANGTIQLRRIQDRPNISKAQVRLLVRDPQIESDDDDDAWRINPAGIPQALSALFPEIVRIEAMQDANEDVTKFKTSTTIGKLLSQIVGELEANHSAAISQGLDGARDIFEVGGQSRATELVEFDEAATSGLSDFYPGLEIAAHIPVPEFKDFVKGATLKVREEHRNDWGDVGSLGHGAQRSIQMSLIRQISRGRENQAATDCSRKLLLIDEPELYLHPQAVVQVREALRALSLGEYQVVFSTHAPQMLTSDDMKRTLVIHKDLELGTIAKPRLDEEIERLSSEADHQVDLMFDLTRSSLILFSEYVVITEGKTELRLLPDLYHIVTGRKMDADKIALISVGGVGSIKKSLEILTAMGIKARAIVDLDFLFRQALRANLVAENSTEFQSCLARLVELSEEHGFALAEGNGLPMKSEESNINPRDAFALLGEDADGAMAIRTLCSQVLECGIWVWPKGDIERHLGVSGHGPNIVPQFLTKARAEGFDENCHDAEGFRRLFRWIGGE